MDDASQSVSDTDKDAQIAALLERVRQLEQSLAQQQKHSYPGTALDARILPLIPDHILIYDFSQNKLVFVNHPLMPDGLAFDALEQLSLEDVRRSVHTEDLHEVDRHFMNLRHMAPGQTIEQTFRMRHIDGEWRWLHSRSTVLSRDNSGMARELMHHIRDVTDIHNAEDAYRALVDGSLQGLAILQDYRLVFVNEALCQLTGYSRHQLLRMNVQALGAIIHPEDREEILTRFANTELGAPLPDALRLRAIRGNGDIAWLELSVREIEYRGSPALHVTYIDITERVRTQAALDEGRALLQRLAEMADYAVYIYDMESRHNIYANPYTANLLGMPLADVQNAEDDVLESFYHPDDRGAWSTLYQRNASASDSEIVMAEFRVRQRDDSWRWIRVQNVVLQRSDAGEVRYVLGIANDITEQKEAQQRTIAYELEAARARIIAQFIRDAAHEFRTPLAIINTAAHILRRLSPPEAETYVRRIEAQTAMVVRLVEDLSTIAQLDAHIGLQWEQVILMQVLEEVITDLSSLADTNEIHLELQIRHRIPAFRADHKLLWQAFRHLTENALRHTPRGGQVRVILASEDAQAWITISDTGVGIREDELPRLFQSFYRSDHTHSTPGFGLGLPIAKRIIEAHRGVIHIESIPDEGTTVLVRLPMYENP